MSEERRLDAGGSRPEAGGSRLDAAIDGAVRQMLDVEQPGGLRRRVLQRIDGRRHRDVSGFRRKLLWTSLPVAAVAMVALMVLSPSSTPPQPQVPDTVATTRLPAPVETPRTRVDPSPRPAAPRPARVTARAVSTSEKPERMIAAAALETEDTSFALPPLDMPEALSIRELVTPATPSLPSTAPEPMHIQALAISALSELPPERRKE